MNKLDSQENYGLEQKMVKNSEQGNLVSSLINLVREINNTPEKNGYRQIKKRTPLKASVKGVDFDPKDSFSDFDIVPKDSFSDFDIVPKESNQDTTFLVKVDPSIFSDFDIVPKDSNKNNTPLPVEVVPPNLSKFDPSKYFSLDSGSNPSSPGEGINNINPPAGSTHSRESYEHTTFAPLAPVEKPSDYSPLEVMEMIRELKALRKS